MIKFLISIIMSSFPALLNACCCGSDDDVAIRHHPPLHQQMRSMAAVPQPGYGTPPLPQHQPVSSIKEKRFEDRAVTGIVLDSLNSLESQNAKYTKENVIKTFYHYQTPEGMLPKLMELQNYYLNFIIDDSGSMAANSYWQDAEGRRITTSRWEEVKYRLQIFFHHLACVPIQYIQISFLNRPDLMKFNPQQYGSMREFINAAQQQIEQIFRQGPNGFTPIYDTLCNAFQQQGRWYHYLFTDGEPTDRNGNDYGQAEAVARIITQRSTPENHLFTVITCSDQKLDWLELLDRNARFVSVIDDYETERNQVLAAQGRNFQFPYGLWIACHLLSAKEILLDNLDEKKVMTESQYESITGVSNHNKYQEYCAANPQQQNAPTILNPI